MRLYRLGPGVLQLPQPQRQQVLVFQSTGDPVGQADSDVLVEYLVGRLLADIRCRSATSCIISTSSHPASPASNLRGKATLQSGQRLEHNAQALSMC